MASDLHQKPVKATVPGTSESDRLATQRMRKDFQFRFSALVLAFVTLAAVIFAGINVWKEGQNPLPDDGVFWLENGDALQAQRVNVGGAGDVAGIKPGDK